ncbi:hypothetical protein MRX96_029657 [Rhipicephalus microplus]
MEGKHTESARGFNPICSDQRVICLHHLPALSYIVDIVLLADSTKDSQQLPDKCSEEACAICLRFQPAKSACMAIMSQEGVTQYTENKLILQGNHSATKGYALTRDSQWRRMVPHWRTVVEPSTPQSLPRCFIRWLTPNLTLVLGTAMMTITMALIPVCHVLAVLAVVLAIMGFFMGCIDTVANVYMIRIYSKDVSPFLQALHFFYGIGAFVSPMIAQPFLLNEDCSLFIDNSSEPMLDQEDMNPSGGGLPASSLAEAQEKTHIDYAFWIMALLMVPVVLLALSLVGKQWYRRRLASQDPGTKQAWYESVDDPSVPAVPDKTGKATGASQIILVALLTAAMMFLYDGLQAAYGGYIYSYAVKGSGTSSKSRRCLPQCPFLGQYPF